MMLKGVYWGSLNVSSLIFQRVIKETDQLPNNAELVLAQAVLLVGLLFVSDSFRLSQDSVRVSRLIQRSCGLGPLASTSSEDREE